MRQHLARDAWILLAAVMIGSLFGAAHNLIDCRIGPQFYILF